MSLPNYGMLQVFTIILNQNVFQNPELFGTQVSLSPEQSTLALASDHPQIWQTHLWKATSISEHNFLKIANSWPESWYQGQSTWHQVDPNDIYLGSSWSHFSGQVTNFIHWHFRGKLPILAGIEGGP
jgi:hypothetical protein